MLEQKVRWARWGTRCVGINLLLALALAAQGQSGESSSSSTTPQANESTSSRPRISQPEASGAAITLETSEPLFDVATAMNACGYDADLAHSNPVRAAVRAEVDQSSAASPRAAASRAAVCAYMAQHELTDKARETAQYVSLALFTGPGLEPNRDQTEMPPDALQVVNLLPLLRTFATETNLHSIWLEHRPEYEAILARVHDPVTSMILNTNVYLRVPVSSYDGRRLLILVEPMLAPNAVNARIYTNDYVVVTSPTAAGAIQLDQVRHLYLHYEIEPLVYTRASSMQRLVPLLKPVQDAPLDFIYKSDVVALVTECLIKAIEAHFLKPDLPVPVKPTGTRARIDLARYDEEQASYDRQANELRARQVELDMRQGWVLTEYFYAQLGILEHGADSLSESMGQMVYGMDIARQKHREEQIDFLPAGSGEFVRRVARPPSGMMLAEKLMLEGKLDEAEALADKALADPHQDHSDATYVKARVALMEGDPESSSKGFTVVLAESRNPHTLAWSHVYLGRLYDTRMPAERSHAVTEYKSALAVPGVPPDAQAAAQAGLKAPFTVPSTVHREEEPLDPSGKAEKDSYKPEP